MAMHHITHIRQQNEKDTIDVPVTRAVVAIREPALQFMLYPAIRLPVSLSVAVSLIR